MKYDDTAGVTNLEGSGLMISSIERSPCHFTCQAGDDDDDDDDAAAAAPRGEEEEEEADEEDGGALPDLDPLPKNEVRLC